MEERIFKFTFWLLAACILAAIVTSCSPYGALYAPMATATPSPIYSPTQNPPYKSEKSIPTPRPACYVTGETVYLRSGAGMQYAPLTVLQDGDSLEVLKLGAWLFVSTGERAGYIHSHYCEIGE